MLATAIEFNGPAAVRFPRGSGLGIALEPEIKKIPVGEAELLRDGDDVLIAAIGTMVHPALEAAQELANEGIGAAVLNARFVKPLDTERLLSLARKVSAVVTVEEHVAQTGFGSAVLEALAEAGVQVPVRCLAVPDEVIEHGHDRASVGLGVADITAAASSLVERAGRAD